MGPYCVGDWWKLLPAPWAQIAMALVAVLCGALVGAEREKHEKPAGLRTLVLVCLGSTTFTMVSFAFTTTTGDSGRVAAQIVTGIGFLGAGVILHGTSSVKGTTTAATVWMVAATGMTVGAGYPVAGLALALLTRATLSGIYLWEDRSVGPRCSVEVVFDLDSGKSRLLVEKILDDYGVGAGAEELTPPSAGVARMRVTFRLPHRQRREFLSQLASISAVREISAREE